MNKTAIIGFGELGRQFSDFLSIKKEFVAFDDDLFADNKKENVFPFTAYNDEKFSDYDFYVALGYHHLENKTKIIRHLIQLKRSIPFFVHPTSFLNSSASIGRGTFVYPMCNIDREVKIGNGVLINNSVCISHHSVIDDGCYISPGVILSGNVAIGEKTFIGSGVIISNNVKIGSNVKIGVGTVITKDIPNGCSAVGNPAKQLNKDIKII